MAKKYIDADVLVKKMLERGWRHPDETTREFVEDDLPAADVIEVCRCEHCSKSGEHLNGRWCKVQQTMVQNSDYCSWGTKR